jgi:hypothetical protein
MLDILARGPLWFRPPPAARRPPPAARRPPPAARRPPPAARRAACRLGTERAREQAAANRGALPHILSTALHSPPHTPQGVGSGLQARDGSRRGGVQLRARRRVHPAAPAAGTWSLSTSFSCVASMGARVRACAWRVTASPARAAGSDARRAIVRRPAANLVLSA